MDIDSYSEQIKGFVKVGNYHAAINVALSGLNQCDKEHDQNGVDECLGIIEGIVQKLAQAYGSKEYLER